MPIFEDLEQRAAMLTNLVEETTELVDQVPDMSRGLPLDKLARITVALRDLRDAVDLCKRRSTHALLATDEQFCRKLLDDDDTTYRTATHTFTANARGFFTMPSQLKSPDEFSEAMLWLHELQPDCLDIDENGLVIIEDLNGVCNRLLEEGQAIHPRIKSHIVPSIRVRKK